MGSYKFPDTLADRTGSQICHCEEAAGRRGNLGKAVTFSPMASQLSGRVLRDCHVASLLAMTRQESARCTSALARLNCPPRGAQGTPLHFPSGPFRVFCAKKIPEAQASGIFSLSKKSLWAFSPSCFQNCKINFCSMILQFCRCGGLWNAKGNPDGFLSHFPSLRNFRLGRFL